MDIKDLKVGDRVTFTIEGMIERNDNGRFGVKADGNYSPNYFVYGTKITNLQIVLPPPAVGDTFTMIADPKGGPIYVLRAILEDDPDMWVYSPIDRPQAVMLCNRKVFDDSYVRIPKAAS